jgi:hypothetical protein
MHALRPSPFDAPAPEGSSSGGQGARAGQQARQEPKSSDASTPAPGGRRASGELQFNNRLTCVACACQGMQQ